MPEWRKFEFERDKFRALILYFSRRGQEDGLVIGSTKLNKLLFFADFRAYAELGAPITGARYRKLPWGPAAAAMLPVRGEMIERQEAHFDPRYDQADVLVPDWEYPSNTFTDDELRVADAVFEELRPFNAQDTSDYSHFKSAGWRVMEEGEDIPYESAFVSTDPAPEEAIELGRRLAARFGW